jgi:hypothetical protein
VNKFLEYLNLTAWWVLVLGMGGLCIWLLLVLDLIIGYKWVVEL